MIEPLEQASVTITLQEFVPTRKCAMRSSVIIGKRNTGKTTLIKDLISKTCVEFPHGTIIAPTEKLLYEGVVPVEQLHESYSADKVIEVLKRQTNIEIEDRRAYFVLDNCMYDTSWTKDPMLLSLVLFTQSYHLTVFLSMAYALAMQPTMRDNIDYVFIFREPIEQNRKRLYEFYGGLFPSYDVFCAVLDAYATDHTCLVIDNTNHSTRLEDRVFYYKAST